MPASRVAVTKMTVQFVTTPTEECGQRPACDWRLEQVGDGSGNSLMIRQGTGFIHICFLCCMHMDVATWNWKMMAHNN